MNNPDHQSAPAVTTGPLPASAKVYTAAPGFAHLRVPHRDIATHDQEQPTVRVYDTSGPYSDAAVTIDVEQGLAPMRAAWYGARGVSAR